VLVYYIQMRLKRRPQGKNGRRKNLTSYKSIIRTGKNLRHFPAFKIEKNSFIFQKKVTGKGHRPNQNIKISRHSSAPAAQGRPPSTSSSSQSPFDLASEAEVELEELYRDTVLRVVSLDHHYDDFEPDSPQVAAALDNMSENDTATEL